MLAQKADEIEKNLILLGVTGVEDKLQVLVHLSKYKELLK